MRSAKVDANQSEVVSVLREVGASVQILNKVGNGCPDLLVGYLGRNFVMEVKDGSKSPSRRHLTPDEQKWHAGWKGRVVVVLSPRDALQEIYFAP